MKKTKRERWMLADEGFAPRSICSTGAEEAAAIAAFAEASGTAGAAASMGAGAGAGAFGAATGAFGPTLGTIGGYLANNAIPLGLQAGGAVMKGMASNDAAERRQKLLDAMGAYQRGNASKAMDTTGKFIEGSTPEARAQAANDAEAQAKAGFDRTVGAASAFENNGAVSGNLSEQFKAKSADSADAASKRNAMLIANLSKMRAPGMAGAAEARRYGRAAGDVSALNNANTNVGGAFQTDMQNVQESPWASVGGDALSGVGQGLLLKGGLSKLRASAL